MAKPPPQLALPEIDLEEKVVEVKVRLKGPAAVELADYQRAYRALKGDASRFVTRTALKWTERERWKVRSAAGRECERTILVGHRRQATWHQAGTF